MASVIIAATLALAVGGVVGAVFTSGSTSENIANETVNNMVSSATTVAQECTTAYTQNQVLTIDGLAAGGDVNINVNGTQTLKMDSSCLASGQTLTSVLTAVSQNGQQTADAITQMFSLSSADSKNVANITANMSTQVTNTFFYNCVNAGTQTSSVTVENVSAAGDINIAVSYGQYIDAVSSCVSNDSIVTQSKAQLQQSIDQTASSKVANTFAVILGVIFAIIAVVGIIVLTLIYFLTKKKPVPKEEVTEGQSIIAEADIKALLDFSEPITSPSVPTPKPTPVATE